MTTFKVSPFLLLFCRKISESLSALSVRDLMVEEEVEEKQNIWISSLKKDKIVFNSLWMNM